MDSFLNPGGRTRTLADLIMEKIAEKEAQQHGDEDEDDDALPDKVIEAYTGMVPLLRRYRCGKLPKAFKVIPALERWEEILWMTGALVEPPPASRLLECSLRISTRNAPGLLRRRVAGKVSG